MRSIIKTDLSYFFSNFFHFIISSFSSFLNKNYFFEICILLWNTNYNDVAFTFSNFLYALKLLAKCQINTLNNVEIRKRQKNFQYCLMRPWNKRFSCLIVSLFFSLFFFIFRSIETKEENPLIQYFEANVANKDRERKRKKFLLFFISRSQLCSLSPFSQLINHMLQIQADK